MESDDKPTDLTGNPAATKNKNLLWKEKAALLSQDTADHYSSIITVGGSACNFHLGRETSFSQTLDPLLRD